MPAVKTGFTPPPMPGMPAPMQPMGGMPPALGMGGGMPPAPNPFAPMPPAPLAGAPMPQPPMAQGQQQQMMGSTAGRRRKFGDALEGMLGRNQQGLGAMSQPQRPMPMPPMMPQQRMVAPGTPMMRTPTPRPMRNGGIVQYFENGGLSAVEQQLVDKHGFSDAGDGKVYTPGGLLYDHEAGDTYSDRLVSGLSADQMGDTASTQYMAPPDERLSVGSTLQLQQTPDGRYQVVDTSGDKITFSDIYSGNYDPEFQKKYADYLGENSKYGSSGFSYTDKDAAMALLDRYGYEYGGDYVAPVEEVVAQPVEEVVVQQPVTTITGAESGPGSAVTAGGNFGTGTYKADAVDVSEINPIDYSQFTGDVGNFAGTNEESALFGPKINIPQSVSQYMTDPETGGLTTSYGPEMVATSPIGAIKLPARPVSIDIFDWLSAPTYGSIYSGIDPIKKRDGGIVQHYENAGEVKPFLNEFDEETGTYSYGNQTGLSQAQYKALQAETSNLVGGGNASGYSPATNQYFFQGRPMSASEYSEAVQAYRADNPELAAAADAVNSFDPETGTYTIAAGGDPDTAVQYSMGTTYDDPTTEAVEELPADVAYSKRVQENRAAMGLPENTTSAWALYQRGEHYSQRKRPASVDSVAMVANPEVVVDEVVSAPVSSITGAQSGAGSAVGAGGNFGTGSYVADPVDSSEINPIDYSQFTGDVGNFAGSAEENALFGPNINIPQSVSQYMTDSLTGGLTTSYGPEMVTTSPIGAIKLPARPVSIDIFDWLSSPTYGTMYSGIEPIEMRDGGSVPRETMIADEPHMLAYINQDEEALLRSFGGSGISGPGGIPSYPPVDLGVGAMNSGKTYSGSDKAVVGGLSNNVTVSSGGPNRDDDDDDRSSIGSSGNVSLDAIAAAAAATADDDKPSGSVNTSAKDADLAVGGSDKTVTAADLTSGGGTTTYDTGGGGSVTVATGSGIDDILGSASSDDTLESVVSVIDPVSVEQPVVYTDRLGRQYGSQAEADLANRQLDYASLQNQIVDNARDFVTNEFADRGLSASQEDIDYYTMNRLADLEGDAPFTYSKIAGIGSGPASNMGSRVGGLAPIDVPVGDDVDIFSDPEAADNRPIINLDSSVLGTPAQDYATMPMGEMGRGTRMPLTGSADMPPELLPMNTPREAYDTLFDRSEGRGASMPGYGAEKRLIEMAEFPDSKYKIDYQSLMAPDLPLTDDDMGLPSGPYTPSAFPSGRSAADIFQPTQEADVDVTKEALMNAVKQRVSEVEGTADQGGYDRLLGGQEDRFGVKPSEMTVAEVLDFQKKRGEGSYAEYAKDAVGRISTPVGKYQIVGTTLQSLVDQGVVDPNAKFDAATQEMLGSYLIENRGLFDTDKSREDFVTSLGKEFEGIQKSGYDGTVAGQLKQGLGATQPTTSGDSEAARMAKLYDRGLGEGDDPRRANLAVNAAEAKYLQNLLEAVDDPNILEQILGQIGSNLTFGMIDFNKLTRDQAQKVLDAYRETGSFVYDTEGNAIDLQTVEDLEKLEALSAGEGQLPAVIGVRDGEGEIVSSGSSVANTVSGPEVVNVFEEESSTEDDGSGETKNYTMGPDGAVVCNDEGYVYNPETDTCEPPAEKSDTVSSPIATGGQMRSFEDILAGITTPAPKIAPISANIRPMQGGGMAGLNRAADNFLKALAG